MKIMFIDDDKNVLNGLRRSLFNYADKWEMTFCSEGREAMEVLDREQPDIVVTDMRMPHMDGAEVLSMVQEKHPEVVRIVLSGHSELDMVMKSVKPAHQFLSKPCPEEELISTLEHAFQLREIMTDQRVKKIVSGLEELPALPELYVQVREELAREDYSMERVGNLISKDLGMSTTILKLVNSSFFGLRRHVSSPAQAVVLLGSEIVESLILTVKLFSEFKPGSLLNYSINELSQHGVATGAMARVIAQSESQPVESCDRCFVAGVLHDVGKLILASGFNEEYAEIIGIVQKENRGVRHVEQRFFKTTHAQVGALCRPRQTPQPRFSDP